MPDRGISPVSGQHRRGLLLQPGDLAVQHGDQRAQRGDLAGVRLRQWQPLQPDPAAGPEDIAAGDRDAGLGQHRMHLVLAAGPLAHQLMPVPGDFPQLADRRRGDPRFGQLAHPQQVS
jgi:hypothetical protein